MAGMRRLVGGALAAFVAVVLALAGAACRANPAEPVPSPSTSAVALITMPDVIGQNAAVALDSLTKLGFTNIDLGTVDGHAVVVLPQNWVVAAQSAKGGTQLPADAKIVLGCRRIGQRPWPL
jgi:hypothetical protein